MASLGVEPQTRAALIDASSLYALVVRIHEHAAQGNEASALRALATVAGALPGEIHAIDALLSTQAKAAEAFDLTERTLARFFPRLTQPHPDAANDHSRTPSEQPTDGVA